MGAVLRGALRHLTADRHWEVDDLAPPFCRIPFPAASDEDELSARSYLWGCLRALSTDGWAKGKPIRWRIPENVRLSGRAGSKGSASDKRETEGQAVADVLPKLLLALSSYHLVTFSVEGHSEVTAADVHHWASWFGSDAVLMTSSVAPWRNIRVANLSDCSLGDAGVQALFSIVFPSATASTAPSREGSGHAVPSPFRALLPSLEYLILDGVGLTDRGAVWVTSYLDAVARCRDAARSCGARDDASAPPCRRDLLHTLSLQRNTLGVVGVVKFLRTSLVRSFSAGSENGRIVDAVDLSWNSLVSGLRGCTGEGENSWAVRRKLLIALGAGMARFTCERQPPAAAEALPPHRGSLLLRGCGVDEADVRALYTEGFLFAFLEWFREAGHREVGDLLHSSARQVSLPPLCMHLTKIDLSHNPSLGDRGVGQLLSALLCLEETREVSRTTWAPLGSAQHTFVSIEEIVLRDVGCTDAVLANVVRLLSSSIHRAISSLAKQGCTGGPLSKLEGVFEEEVHRILLDEVHILAGLRAEGDQQHTENSAKKNLTPCTYLPSLRLLDLSENSFYSATLIGAVMAGAALRASYVPSLESNLEAMEHCAVQKGDDLLSRKTGLSRTAGEDCFALGLEDCGLTDTALLQFPHSLQLLCVVMPTYERPLFSTDYCPSPVEPRHPTQPQSRRCTWYLGGNRLTHSTLLRLRKFTETLMQCTSLGSQLCTVNAYVERNAILHPVTTVEQSAEEEDVENSEAVVMDGADVSWLGIAVAQDKVSCDSITKRACSASNAAFADRHSALHDFMERRVSWQQLPSLRTFAAVERVPDPSHFCIASTPLQRRGPHRNAAEFDTCAVHSVHSTASGAAAPAPIAGVTAPDMRNAQEWAYRSRGTSGEPETSLTYTDGDTDDSVGSMGFHDHCAALWALPWTMTVHTNDPIDALIAEAEQVMRERRHFVEVGRHLGSPEMLSDRLPPSLPDTDSGLG